MARHPVKSATGFRDVPVVIKVESDDGGEYDVDSEAFKSSSYEE
jgi:hypothetical protein